MFFPGYREDALDDVVRATAAGSWAQGLLPVLTHLLAVPAAIYTWRIRAYRAFAAIIIDMIASGAYHMCLAWPGAACFGLPLDTLRLGDYIWSPYLFAVAIEFVLRLYVYPWVSAVTLAYMFVIVFASLAHPFSLYAQLLLIVVGALLLFFKAAVLDSTHDALGYVGRGTNAVVPDLKLDRPGRFHVVSLLFAAVFSAAAFVGFANGSAETYWIFHAVLWHSCIYLSLFFIMVGTTRDVPGWFDILHCLSHADDDAQREIAAGGDSPKVVFYSSDIETRASDLSPLPPSQEAAIHYRRGSAEMPPSVHSFKYADVVVVANQWSPPHPTTTGSSSHHVSSPSQQHQQKRGSAKRGTGRR